MTAAELQLPALAVRCGDEINTVHGWLLVMADARTDRCTDRTAVVVAIGLRPHTLIYPATCLLNVRRTP